MARWIYVGPKLSTGEPERNLSLSGISMANADGDIDDEGLNDEQMAALRASEFWKSEAGLKSAQTRKKQAAVAERQGTAKKTPKIVPPKPAPEPTATVVGENGPELIAPPDTDQPTDEAPPADSGETE